MADRLLGHYRLVDLVGAGGMGEVFRARDERLDRDVAVKVLPEAVAADPDRLARFEREAKALARIEHPNILTIHDFGHDTPAADPDRPTYFAVTELLTGETLTARLARERLAWRRAVEIGAAVADGLAAAHGQGIVHRDLKPDNIFLTADGRVKILDFGLATSGLVAGTAAETGLLRGGVTTPGAVLGTVGYMAPEQVQGAATIDGRADLFAVGCVLFEMVTGRQAFARATPTETLAAILSAPAPELLPSGSDAPAELGRIVSRCLEKQPGARFQSASDLAFALRALTTAPVGVSVNVTTREAGLPARDRPRSQVPVWLWGGLTALALVAVVAISVLVWRRGPLSGTPVPRVSNPIQITRAMGIEVCPTWSPDGRMLAYQSDESGNLDIWVSQFGSTEAVNRTAENTKGDALPSWSPDGRWIAFASERDEFGYYVMAAVGGAPRKVVTFPESEVYPVAARWSPDSTQLAYVLGQNVGPWIEIVTIATSVSRKVALPAMPRGNVIQDLNWSPDGRWLAYSRGASPDTSDTYQLWLTPVAGGESVQLTDGTRKEMSPSWSPDSRSIFFVSNRAGTGDLWRLRLNGDGRPEGPAQQVTAGIEMFEAALSVDGQRLAYAKVRQLANAFRVPVLTERQASWTDATQLTADEAKIEFLDVSRDGRLAVNSDRSGNFDLWTLPAGGGALQQVTTDPAPDTAPRWKPDGSEIAFYSQRTGKREIWTMPAGGGPARQVTRAENDCAYPTWSPDGRRIAFMKVGIGVFTVSVSSGEERCVTSNPNDLNPEWSPDGKWISFDSYRGERDGYSRLWRVPAEGGQAERLTEGPAGAHRWSPDGKRVFFVGKDSIRVREIDTRQERSVTALAGRRGNIGALATDGRFLYFLWHETRGDVWVADIVDPGERQ